ncbi:autotransporter-associated beta strand repeat-containing protein [Pseudaquabacterium pictum]|uniref:Filamentous haemagglutinin FhaB/tRNA nuclease CdiA-like TPS domain-containing protein n=1 Tax=Pseudaquabacterium pictum TaxID=2315236 RepID=A0A480ATL6_9BURK|nr:autotransporter-associated beta strand repeat-containing protein [Rubrivivax pictus]GCL63442.1 hypothetical protein AQPW35_25230 [Rubrivivax pictus]
MPAARCTSPHRPHRLRRLRPVCMAAAWAVALAALPSAWALPEGAVPTLGQAQLLPSAPGTLQILQGSQRAGFDWRSFNIAAGERVQVLQPNAQAILFNRVTGADPSLILGQLQSNGRVFLSNPRGIVFGAGSQVDVGGLLATTLSVNTTALADGRWQLSGGDAATGLLRADGSIRAPGGTVALVGPQLSVGGNILAGRLGLAAAGAAQVDVDGDGLIFFNLRDENLAARLQLLPAASLLARSAELRAAARSQFADTVLNLEGVVRAQGLVQQDGQVVIGGVAPQILVDGGAGVTRLAGTLDASATATGETGGQVRVLGERVWLDSTARIDARGDAGGGLVHVGGAWQGAGPDRNAVHTRVVAGAQIDASAIRLGDGGQVVVWADDSTVFNGHIRARGGLLGGDGGAVETSGKLRLGIGSGTVDAGAAAGFRSGRWLLDPLDINVKAPVVPKDPPDPEDPIGVSDGTEAWNDAPTTTLNITPAALQNAKALVLLQATRNIGIEVPVTLTEAGATFTAEAGGDVTITATGGITTTNSAITLIANQSFGVAPPATSPATGTGRVVVLGVLDAGSAGIGIDMKGGTGQHVLGGSFKGASLTVTGAATLAPAVTFDVGSLTLAGAVTLPNNSTITVETGRTLTIAGAIGDGVAPAAAFGITKAGAGSLQLSGANTYRGGTMLADGTLVAGSVSALGTGSVTLNDAAATSLQVTTSATVASLAGGGGSSLGVTLSNDVILTTGEASSTYSGKITAGTGSVLRKAGSGEFTLDSATGFAGTTQLVGGTLALDHADALKDSVVTLSSTAASTLAVTDSTTVKSLGGGALAAGLVPALGNVTLAAGKTLTTGEDSSSYSGTISGTGTLEKAGAGNFTLNGATGFTGATQLNGGTLTLGHADALKDSAVTLSSTAASTLAVIESTTVKSLGGGAVAAGLVPARGNVTLAAGKVLTTGEDSSSYSGTISGTGTLEKAGAGDFTLNGATGFTGATQLDGGTLTLGHADALKNSAVTLSSTAASTLAVIESTTVKSLGGGAVAAGPVPARGNVTLAAGKTLTTGEDSSSYSGTISGTGTLEKAGAGNFTLNGATGLTGATQLNGGTLTLGHADALKNSAVTLSSTAASTLAVIESTTVKSLGGGAVAAGPVPARGNVTLAAGKTLTTGEDSSSYSGTISGTGTLEKAGAGNFTLNGATGFTGATQLDGGTLTLGHADALKGSVVTLSSTAASTLAVIESTTVKSLGGGAVAAGLVPARGNVTLAAGKVLTTGEDSSSYSGTISGTGTLEKAGAGNFTLNGATGFTGATQLDGGTLTLGHADALKNSAVTLSSTAASTLAVIESTTVKSLGGGAPAFGNVTLAAGKTLTTGEADSSYSGTISGTGTLEKAGAGNFRLNGATGFTGATQLNGGTLTLGHADALKDSAVTLDSAEANTLQVAANSTVASLAGGGGSSLGVTLADTVTLTTGADSSTYSGKITAGTGSVLRKAGAGNFTLNGATGFTGATLVDAGTLTLTASNALVGSTVTLGSTGTNALVVATSSTLAAVAGGGAGSTLQLDDLATLTTGTASSRYSGSITGGGQLHKVGGGTFTLAGSNSAAGSTTVSAGTLVLDGTGALASGTTLVVDGSGSLDLGDQLRSPVLLTLDTTGQVTNGRLQAGVFRLQAGTLDARLEGGGSLQKQGSGTVSLRRDNPFFTGHATVSAGTLSLDAAGALGPLNQVTLDGPTPARLAVNADTTLRALAGGANGTVAIDTGVTLTNGIAGEVVDTSFAGSITGAGRLTQQGSGSLTLSGSNDFTGGTTLTAGILVLSGGSALANAGAVQVGTGATLQLAGSETVGTLSGSGTVALGSHTLTTGTGANSSFSGNIVGTGSTGSLVKQGGGRLTLGGSNQIGGGTRVAAGRLTLGSDGALADGAAVQVDSGATLQLQVDETLATLSGTGTVDLGSRRLTLDSAAANSFGGRIDGSGSLQLQGGGSLLLSGRNGYTGGTTVLAGTLRLAGSEALADTGTLHLATGSTLALDARETVGTLSGAGAVALGSHALTVRATADASFIGNIGGGGSLVKEGAALLSLGGNNTQLGGTTVAGGALQVDSNARLGAATAPLVLDGGTLRAGDFQTLDLGSARPVVIGSSGGTLETAFGATLTVAGAVSGSGSLAKQGSGTLRLQGNNSSFTGSLALQGGVLRASGGQALPDAGTVSLANFSTLAVDATETLGQLSGNGTVVLATGSLLRLGTAADGRFDGSIGGDGGLVKQGAGTLTLGGINTQSGRTEVLQGTLAVASDASLGSSLAGLRLDGGRLRLTAAGLVQLPATRGLEIGDAGGTVEVAAASAQLDLLGALSGAGTLRKQGAGSLRLAGAGSGFGGGIDLAAGTLRLDGGQALPDATSLVLAAGSLLRIDADEQLGQLSGTGSVLLGSGARLTLGTAADASFGGSFSGTGSLAKVGSGALTLAGASSHSGGTSVLRGRLRISSDSQLGEAAGALTLDGGVLATTGNSPVALAAGRTVVVGMAGGTLETTATAGLTLAGPLSGSGRLTKQGAGELALAGNGSSYGGAVAVQAGQLALQNTTALGAGNDVQLDTGTQLRVARNVSLASLAGTGLATLDAGTTLTTGFGSSRFDGVLAGDGALHKQGVGTLTLAGTNTLRGGATLDAGTLHLLGGQALPDDTALAIGGGVLQVSATERLGTLSGAGGVVLDNGSQLTIGTGTSASFSGSFSGAGSLVKQGTGTLTLAGSSSHDGGTTVAAGALVVSADAALGAATAPLTLDGGRLRATGGGTVALAAQRRVVVDDGGGTLAADAGTTLRLDGPLSGGGNLVKAGAGTLALAGANPGFSGAVQLSAGTLALQQTGALGAANAVAVAVGSTLDLGADVRLGPLSGAGAVQLHGFTLAAGGGSGTFSGTLGGSPDAVLQWLGGGQLSLTGVTGFAGSTQVLGGTLALAQADVLADSPVSVAPGATLAVLASSRVQSLAQPGDAGGAVQLAAGATLSTGGAADTRFDGSITGAGILRKLGGGRFTLGGSSSHTGGTLVDAGTLQGDSRSLQGDITVATQLVFDQADAGTYAGRLSGAGSLAKQGAGSLLLTGVHQHTGGTEVQAGTLRLAGGQAVPDAGAVSIAAGANLQVEANETLARLTGNGAVQLLPGTTLTLGDATDTRFDGTLAGSGALVKQGSGQLTLAGVSGHSGSTLVQAGRLTLDALDVLADSTVTLAGAADVALQLLGDARIGALASTDGPGTPVVALGSFELAAGGNGASTRFAGRTEGIGRLVKQGGGVLTLAAENGHTGTTQLQAGSLVLAGGQTLALASALQIDAGATLVLAAPQTVGTLTGAGAVQLGAFQLTSRTDEDSLFAGQISGSAGLVKQGSGRLTLGGSNLFSGMTEVQQGTLALAGGAALADSVTLQIGDAGTVVASGSETVGALAGSGALVLEAGRFTTGGSGSSSFSGTITGSGELAKAGTGTLTLSGANSHTGGLALLGGTLAVAADNALGAVPDAGTPANLLFDGGTLQATGSFGIAAARQLLLQGAGGTLQVDAGHTLTLPATLADGSSAGSLSKTGAGTLALTAATDSARSGSTLVQAGTLALQRDGQLGLPAGALVLDGGTLQVDTNLRLADARTLQLGAAGGTLAVGGGATLALAGLVTDQPGASGGALAKTGAGQLLLDGAFDNTYTGATLLRGGRLALQRDGQLGTAPAEATPGQLFIDGATLQVGGDTVLAASRGLAVGGAGATLEVADGRALTLAGAIGDAVGARGGTVTKAGGGLLRLQGSAPSSHTGATQVLAGTLALSADTQLGAVPGLATPGHLLLDGGTLLVDAGFTLDARRGLQLGAGGGVVDVVASQQLAYAGVLAGTVDPAQGALTKTGEGRLALSGDNTYAGATRVRGGTLAIQGDAQLGSAPATGTPGHLLLDGGTLAVGASTTLAASRGIALGAGAAVLDVATGANVSYGGALADAPGVTGGFDKAGGGSLVLGGVSSHTGTTRVLAGTLATGGDQRLPAAGAVLLANQASLVLGGHQTLAVLGDAPNPGGAPADGSALVDLGGFTLRLDTGAGDERSFYSGAVTGTGGQLLKQGGGTLQLAGSGAGRNLVTVDDGLLVSLGSNSLSAGAEVRVAPGAALRLMAPVAVQSLDLSGRLSGPGGLTASSHVDLRDAAVDTTVATPVLRSQGSSQIQAAVQADSSTVTGGTLTLGAGGSLTSTALAVQGGGTLATQATGQLLGRPAVVVDNGTLQLAGAEQVATLRLAGTLAGSGSLLVDGAATLQDATVRAALDAATLRSSGDTLLGAAVVARDSATLAGGRLTLSDSGRLTTPLLTLEAGTLATGATPALSTGSRLVVQRDATLLLGADQRLASLDLAGTLGAPAVAPAEVAPDGQQRALADAGPAAQLLVDGAVALDGASVFTPLTAATLTTSGATTLAAPVQAAVGTTVAGGLLTVAASGLLTTPSLQVQAGGVATGGSQRLQADTQLALAAGTTLALGGDQTLARLADLGAGGTAAQVQLGSFTLAAGADGSDTVFSGRFSGDGTVAKQGSGTWLLRSDQAHGDTRIEAGTLQLGDGGSSGSLGRGAVVNDGLLRFQRDDAVRLTQDVSGSGSLQQAGSGSLSLASTGLRYTGDTVVTAGSLGTEGADRLPDASHLRLAAGARLATGGDDRLGALTADGAVSLGGSLASTGDQVYNAAVTVTGGAPITLSAPNARIEAVHAGNQWGSQPLSVDAGVLLLGAGRASAAADAAWNPLILGQVTLRGAAGAPGSQVDAGTLQIGAPVAAGAAARGDARLDGLLDLRAGSSLALRAHATPGYQAPVAVPGEAVAVDPLGGRQIVLADDTLWQNTHSLVRSEVGASLQLQAVAGGSIRLGQATNRLEGTVSALSGSAFNAAWKPVDVERGRLAGQSSITLAGQVVQVGGGGVEADVLRLTVGRLGTEAGSPLAARLWYNDASFGQQRSLPGLQITLLPEALAVPASLGSFDQPVQVRVGALDTGGRTEGLNAGYVQLLPKRAAGGAAVFLAGPKVGQAAYSFFQDGAGDVSEVPLFYNNVLPATPQLAGSLSAVASVSETARRERFDETVRTENVAIRLRAGVIAEVGPGRPATQGTQGIRLPSSCSSVGNLLGCGGTP